MANVHVKNVAIESAGTSVPVVFVATRNAKCYITDMEYQKLLKFVRPSDTENVQRWAKILLNSCYDRISPNSDFKLYEAKKK